jgi:ubiquinone/menaquinone biosynthesis C-methylase UbiE
VLGRPFIARYRRELLAHAHGDVLELGFGTGLNLPHYPQGVRKLTTVDPNPGMHRLARRRLERSWIAVEHCTIRGEELPFADATFDCVVSTFTLCSIPKVDQALSEAYRVLKPGGRFLFLEHGLSPDALVRKWQHLLNGLEKLLADGCHLDRNMEELITTLPFAAVAMKKFYLERTPKTHGYMYRGIATK